MRSARGRWSVLPVFVLCLLTMMLAARGAFGSPSTGLPSQAEDASITVEEIVNQVETDHMPVLGPDDLLEIPGTLAPTPEVPYVGFAPLVVGQELAPGDRVRTHWESQARIDIALHGLKRINRTTPNTMWRLGQFAVDAETIIELTDGKLFSIDGGYQEGVPSLQVVTPAGVASVRGTWLSVTHHGLLGITELQCFRGICELTNAFGTQVLTDEQKSLVTALTPPTEPVPLTEEDILAFTELPEALSGEVPVPPLQAPIIDPPTPTPAPTATPRPRPTPTPTPRPRPTPTATPTPRPTPTATPRPRPTPTATPRPTPTATPTPRPTPTATPRPTPTATPTATPVLRATPTPTPTPPPVILREAPNQRAVAAPPSTPTPTPVVLR